ncbi:MAG: phosphoadenylyl-sulfate reductase [Deltaproteobacteria bacterium]|nr:phosphoadenylyl-sulfate reductase [Deltaproteobacteria bacterium]NND27934.1 phosphoadenylyl-sulfate reductase [Myxococcales bacterium]MBT8463113.1 phosphoadenylyl-sulfate reductase [Deltaproteobacteria bacterium]MBT8482855.1 phosphoadenylyl-sulfate reductase [Deltaproteobacteria bacterium]NNK08054.1 phosphoadenylyl-sulfate reductase [Myxococcales bacterium]
MEAARIASVDSDLVQENRAVGASTAEELIGWAWNRFGEKLIASTSFGATSAVMLHLVHRVAPRTPIICVDTGYLFAETYQFAEALIQRLDLDVRFYSAQMTPARQEALYGKLWEQGEEGVDRYLQINKVEPMQRAIRELGADAWMAGLRAEQTEHRAGLRRVDRQNGGIKLHPVLHWTSEDMTAYMDRHDLPYHPMFEQGYRSIGDHHSTIPTTAEMDPRDGRILGKTRECGLHLPLTEEQNQSLKSSGL